MNKLSLNSAIFIGLAAMLGAGVFVVFGPAYELAGSWLPLAILLAGIVAYLNAASIAQLASKITRSGGAYAYGRHYLGDTWGFLAGASFLVGKIGSSAAIALTVASYLTPGSEALTAVGSVVLMTAINIAGINRTAFGSKILASITLGFLMLIIVAALFAPAQTIELGTPETLGVMTAAALVFFAFAGYARVATLGGEVVDSAVNVPRAIRVSLGIVLALYLVVSLVLMSRLGTELGGVTPLADLAEIAIPNVGPGAVAPFAAIAALGSLLALLAGMSRTAAEMATDAELPKAFAGRLKNGTPIIAELVVAMLVIALLLSGSIVFTIGLSSFAILTYYAIANLAAFRQPRSETSRPRTLNLIGLVLCLTLAASVPPASLLLGLAILGLLLFVRWGLRALR